MSTDESALLPGMTDKGRLGFAIQLKFMQLHGRFPERHDEIDPNATQWLAAQLGTTTEALSSYALNGRQGQRHQRTIRVFLGYRPATGDDLKQLNHWLCSEALPFDSQARHGRDLALDWCRIHHLEPPASDELNRTIRSAVRSYEAQQQAVIDSRLSTSSKAAINRLLGEDDTDPDEADNENAKSISFSSLKTDPGKASLDSLLVAIAKLKCIDEIGLAPEVLLMFPPNS